MLRPILLQNNSANYIVASTTKITNTTTSFASNKSQILKLNKNGLLLDSLDTGLNFIPSGRILHNSGYYYLTGMSFSLISVSNYTYSVVIIKFDSALNLTKKVILESSNNHLPILPQLLAKNNRIFVIYSYQPAYGVKVLKLDMGLNKLDSTFFTGNDAGDIEDYDSNQFLIAGSGFINSNINYAWQVKQMDTALNVISSYNLDSLTYIAQCGHTVGLGGAGIELNYLGNKKYMVSGSSSLADGFPCLQNERIINSLIYNNNSVLNTVVTSKPAFHNQVVFGRFTCKKYNNTYLAAYTIDTLINPQIPLNKNSYILVQKTDSSGHLKWLMFYGGDNYYIPTAIEATADSGMVICGIRYDVQNPVVTGVGEAFILKLDKNGGQDYVGIKENEKLNLNFHKCYPNPTANMIKFDVPFSNKPGLCITDALGKTILKITEYYNNSPLDVSGLKPGLYFYKITSSNKVYSGKFVKE